jgi:capsule polysaccharide export protein KpsE/RkpR
MTSEIDQTLGEWRTEIVAELEAMQAELAEKRTALAAAEVADCAQRAQQRALHARINAALSGSPAATALVLRLETAMRDTTGGGVAKLRGQAAELERKIVDCCNALEQIERALTPRDATRAEDSRVAA